MPNNWYVGVFGIVVGAAVLAARKPFAAMILETNRRAWWHRAYPAEAAVVNTMVIAVGLGFVASGIASLLNVPGWFVFLPLFVLTAIGLVAALLKER